MKAKAEAFLKELGELCAKYETCIDAPADSDYLALYFMDERNECVTFDVSLDPDNVYYIVDRW